MFFLTVHHIYLYILISFTNFNAQFLYSLTICMLHYNARHVSSIKMPIFRRTHCIITASGIVTLRKRLYSMPDESRMLSSGILYSRLQRPVGRGLSIITTSLIAGGYRFSKNVGAISKFKAFRRVTLSKLHTENQQILDTTENEKKTLYPKCNIEARSCNHCCSGKVNKNYIL